MIRNPGRVNGPVAFASNREPLAFHRKLPGYAPTPLLDVPALAAELCVARVLVKVESSRLGLPAFKMLGASWATYRTLVERLGREPRWQTIDELRHAIAPLGPLQLAAATDGNHGRAVARMAKLLGFGAHIFVPNDMAVARIDAIKSEGANVTIVQGTYDDAVARSAAEASATCMVISDTSWPGYIDPPRWVIEGYATIFAEIDEQLETRVIEQPTIAFLPAGVGAFAASAVAYYRNLGLNTTLVTVEPADAACVLQSLRVGKMIEVPGPHRSMMVGLNCGNASLIAFPVLNDGIDFAIAIKDDRAAHAMRLLAAEKIVAGETGAASLAGALGIIALGGRELVGLDEKATVLCIVTEGATDPVNYERIVASQVA
ncbi:MAG: diaminopropionate ammonia-lyase [Planctomycetes bacterium]|nr:diaminopropionate ammonia-lyase [Planctomycetota bacterium]